MDSNYFEPLVLAAAMGTGWAAANRLLSSPDLDVGLLLGMVLGASLVILILKARGQDVFLLGPPSGGAPTGTATAREKKKGGGNVGRGGSGGGAGRNSTAAATAGTGARGGGGGTMTDNGGGGGGSSNSNNVLPSSSSSSSLAALRRNASQQGLASAGGEGRHHHHGGGGGSHGTGTPSSNNNNNINNTNNGSSGGNILRRNRTQSGDKESKERAAAEIKAKFAHTLRDPRYKKVKLIDWNGIQIPFNEVVDFENEFFKGRVLFMLRTKPEDPRYVAHFAGKQRLFEMQIQGKFKKLPEGVLYMGAELTEKMHMGLVTKTVANLILTFARRVLKNLHYSFGDKGNDARQNADEVELPHLTFPLSRGMDRLIITPPGEEIPPLGREFMEPDELRIPRRGGKGEEPQFVLGPTYSMSFHSMYMDFSQWQLVNIAGQKSIDLNGYFGDSSIQIVVYDLDASAAGVAAAGGRHRRCDKRYFYHCELMSRGNGAGEDEEKDALGATEAAAGPAHGHGHTHSRSHSHRSMLSPAQQQAAAAAASSRGVDDSGRGPGRGGSGGGDGGSAGADGARPSGSAEDDGLGGSGRSGRPGSGGDVESSHSHPRNEDDEEGEDGNALDQTQDDQELLLGSGVYVRSGDIVPLLATASPNGNDEIGTSISGGGGWGCVTECKGYCIARPGAAPLDVHLIKVGGDSANFRSDFLCNSDVVILRNSVNGKYLSVYKGWWLWWTPNPPSSSSSRAHFVIHGLDEGERLTVGRAFKLRSNKWGSYEVGISESIASEYGGRLLGLYQTSKSKRMFQSKKSKTWLAPLQLKFQAPRDEAYPFAGPGAAPKLPLDDGSMVVVEEEEGEEGEEGVGVGVGGRRGPRRSFGSVGGVEEQLALEEGVDPFFVEKNFSPEEVEESMVVDVPAWIEMVHRRKKKPQLAYALRVRFRGGENGKEETVRWMALRTGIDLAPVIQMQRSQQRLAARAAAAAAAAMAQKLTTTGSVGGGGGTRSRTGSLGGSPTGVDGGGGDGGQDEMDMDIDQSSEPYMLKPSTGKGSKGPNSASKEGKGRAGEGYRSRGGSLDGLPLPSPPVMAAQPSQHQCAPDQSVRLLAQLLEDISASTSSHAITSALNQAARAEGQGEEDEPYPEPPSCKAALYSILKRRNYLDAWFLNGTAADMNVSVPSKPAPPLQQSMVARALWESHWKEEWMVLYSTHVSFFSMGTKKPGWSVFLHDILAVKVPQGASKLRAQFPGKYFLALETLGRVHYLCFGTEAIRDGWLTALAARVGGGQASYEIPVGVVISDPREAFVLKSGQWRPSSRIILNARRMSFDVTASAAAAVTSMSPSQLSEKALRLVYDLSPDSGTERLVAFLDLCSSFRVFPLHTLGLSSDEALAFFLNLYHTLLQHALLLLGPPSSKDWAAFFTSVSYEVGTDVFSLTEIEHCVLRGRLSRPRSVPRHMAHPPHPDDDHYHYALGKADFRVNFALINGSISAPPFVTVFRAEHLQDQLDKASVRFVDYTLKVDTRKRVVVLPKVCDIYRADFSPKERGMETVKVCLRFLDRARWERISWLLAGAKAPPVKYTAAKAKCHETLCLIEDRLSSNVALMATTGGGGATRESARMLTIATTGGGEEEIGGSSSRTTTPTNKRPITPTNKRAVTAAAGAAVKTPSPTPPLSTLPPAVNVTVGMSSPPQPSPLSSGGEDEDEEEEEEEEEDEDEDEEDEVEETEAEESEGEAAEPEGDRMRSGNWW